MHQKSPELIAHLKQEHSNSPWAQYLKEIVYGGNDGVVTTFAVVAGFSGAAITGEAIVGLSFMTVLLFGLANLFADGLSMGLGNFLSIRAEQDLYITAEKKEAHEIIHNRQMEIEETIDILQHKGFEKNDAHVLVKIYQKNELYWIDWMMKHELEMDDPRDTNPIYTGMATFVSFLVFGVVPLLPFLMQDLSTEKAFYISCGLTFMALATLGVIRWRVTGTFFWRAVGESVLIGGISAVVAFGVGVLFRV